MFKSKDSGFNGLGEERTQYETETRASGGSTLIASGANLQGDLKAPGAASVDGRIEGSVCASGDVQIGPKGSVEGEVEGKCLTVAGTIKGKLFAEDKVILLSGAHVEGDIHAQSLKIEDSVFFQGGCVMGEGARKRRSDSSFDLPAPLKIAEAA